MEIRTVPMIADVFVGGLPLVNGPANQHIRDSSHRLVIVSPCLFQNCLAFRIQTACFPVSQPHELRFWRLEGFDLPLLSSEYSHIHSLLIQSLFTSYSISLILYSGETTALLRLEDDLILSIASLMKRRHIMK